MPDEPVDRASEDKEPASEAQQQLFIIMAGQALAGMGVVDPSDRLLEPIAATIADLASDSAR